MTQLKKQIYSEYDRIYKNYGHLSVYEFLKTVEDLYSDTLPKISKKFVVTDENGNTTTQNILVRNNNFRQDDKNYLDFLKTL